MPISERKEVIFIEHAGAGSPEAAEELCRELHQAVIRISKMYGRVAILHDSTGLTSVTEGYARAFAKCFSETKQYGPVQAACIERAWLRVFAKLALTLSGADMQIFSTIADCEAYLRSRGFEFGALQAV